MKVSPLFFVLSINTILVLPSLSWAHSASDPIQEIHNYDSRVKNFQREFNSAASIENRVKNLENQVNAMQSKLLELRHLMASDYPHVKEKMSRYKFDYMDGVENTIKQLKSTLKQTEIILKVIEDSGE